MYNRDLLLIDLESTGLDVATHEIIQIGALLLDRKTLKEKARFDTYVKPTRWAKRSKEAMAVNKITWEHLKNAPSLKEALLKFTKAFPQNVIIANYGGDLDTVFLKAAFRQHRLKYPYDYHVFNMWSMCYTYMAAKNKLNNKTKYPGFSLDDIAKTFKVKVPTSRHDALTDCLVEADVLRHLVKIFKK
jgi:DNA polymerase III epsilon subunit-like protein